MSVLKFTCSLNCATLKSLACTQCTRSNAIKDSPRIFNYKFICYRNVRSQWVPSRNTGTFYLPLLRKMAKADQVNWSHYRLATISSATDSLAQLRLFYSPLISQANFSSSCPPGRNPRKIFVIGRRNKQCVSFYPQINVRETFEKIGQGEAS